MIRVCIVFKSGHVETLSLEELSVRQNGFVQFTELKCKSGPQHGQILMLRIDEIAGVFSFNEDVPAHA